MKPLDYFAPLSAMPFYSGQLQAEVANLAYMQVHNIAESRKENLRRPEKVPGSEAKDQAAFHRLDYYERHSTSIPLVREQRKSLDRERKGSLPFAYNARGEKEVAPVVGAKVDLIA